MKKGKKVAVAQLPPPAPPPIATTSLPPSLPSITHTLQIAQQQAHALLKENAKLLGDNERLKRELNAYACKVQSLEQFAQWVRDMSNAFCDACKLPSATAVQHQQQQPSPKTFSTECDFNSAFAQVLLECDL